MNNMFTNSPNLEFVAGAYKFKTDNVRTFAYMFFGCKKLMNIDVTNWKVHNCVDFNNMFNSCKLLDYLNLSR